MTAYPQTVEQKVIPAFRRQQRSGADLSGEIRIDPAQTGDDQIGVGRMAVILAPLADQCIAPDPGSFPALQDRPRQPFAGEGIQILIDPWDGTVLIPQIMAPSVAGERFEIGAAADSGALPFVEQPGESGQRDRGGKRPGGAVPLAFMSAAIQPEAITPFSSK